MSFRRYMPYPFMFILLLSSRTFSADAALSGPDPGAFQVGYRVLDLQDPARSFGPGFTVDGNRTPRPLSRPVQVHIWYPARGGSGKELHYADYLIMAKGPVETGPGADAARIEILNAWKARPLRKGAGEGALDAILDREMRARLDAAPSEGRFPLIIYAPSINADPCENAVLFEYMASFGYVIASAPSEGLQEPEVSRDREGAVAQIGDLSFVIGRVFGEPFVDRARIGVVGFSWGGMTGLLFAIPHLGIDAVACLDGAATMAEYRPVAESFDCWKPRGLRAALLDIVLAGEERHLGFGENALYADVYSWRLPGIEHRDFSSDSVMKYRIASDDSLAARAVENWDAVAQRLRIFFDAYLKDDPDCRRALSCGQASSEKSPWTFRDALPAPPTAGQFDDIIENQGVEAAARLFHELRARDPEVVVFDEKRLPGFAVEWGPERSRELLALLHLNLEAYPKSVETRFWLGQIYMALEDREAAVRTLEEALAIDPSHVKVRRLLEEIR